MYRLNVFIFSMLALLFFGLKAWANLNPMENLRCAFPQPSTQLTTDFRNKQILVKGSWKNSTKDSIQAYKIGQTELFFSGEKDEATLLLTFHDAILRVEFYHQGSDGQTDEEYVHTGTLIQGQKRWIGGCQTLGK
jgi:hypothetical protein